MEIIILEEKRNSFVYKVDNDKTCFQIVYWVILMDLEKILSLRIKTKNLCIDNFIQ